MNLTDATSPGCARALCVGRSFSRRQSGPRSADGGACAAQRAQTSVDQPMPGRAGSPL